MQNLIKQFSHTNRNINWELIHLQMDMTIPVQISGGSKHDMAAEWGNHTTKWPALVVENMLLAVKLVFFSLFWNRRWQQGGNTWRELFVYPWFPPSQNMFKMRPEAWGCPEAWQVTDWHIATFCWHGECLCPMNEIYHRVLAIMSQLRRGGRV